MAALLPEREAREALESLARTDKWFLSADDGTSWAPPAFRPSDPPGFRSGMVGAESLPDLFTVALVGPDGDADPLTSEGTHWRPDRLRIRWRSRAGRQLTEFRYLLPGGRFCSGWRTEEDLGWPNPVFRGWSLVAFTAVPAALLRSLGTCRSAAAAGTGVRVEWTRLPDSEEGPPPLRMVLTGHLFPPRGHHVITAEIAERVQAALDDACCGALLSEQPWSDDWGRSPFSECWPAATAQPHSGIPSGDRRWIHLAATFPLSVTPARHAVAFTLRALPEAAAPGQDRQQDSISTPLPTPVLPRPTLAKEEWMRFFSAWPRMKAEDPVIERTFTYRGYVVGFNRWSPAGADPPRRSLAEGPGPLHRPAAWCAAAQIREARWLGKGELARSVLQSLLLAQRADGSLPRTVASGRGADAPVSGSHTPAAVPPLGDAVMALDALHPCRPVLEMAYGALSDYALWLSGSRDPEGSGMITVLDSEEMGQGAGPRFASQPGPGIKAVDATVYAALLWEAMAKLAEALEHPEDVPGWRDLAARAARAIQDRMWDEDARIYLDVDPDSGDRRPLRTVAGFAPLLLDELPRNRVDTLIAHLRDPATFGTPHPVPTLAVKDPGFSAEGLWQGGLAARPWNGPMWPAASCMVIEGLLRRWRAGHVEAGVEAGRLLRSLLRTMWNEGDPPGPTAFHHYNPLSGRPARSHGFDDHGGAWVGDLILTGLVGLGVQGDEIVVQPLPVDFGRMEVDAFLGKRRVHVAVEDGRMLDADVTEA
ncbi:MAG: hypothetical protein ACE5GJ_10025 [Gemmatimonadota bacterium]